jgi:hypothetical protein
MPLFSCWCWRKPSERKRKMIFKLVHFFRTCLRTQHTSGSKYNYCCFFPSAFEKALFAAQHSARKATALRIMMKLFASLALLLCCGTQAFMPSTCFKGVAALQSVKAVNAARSHRKSQLEMASRSNAVVIPPGESLIAHSSLH